MTQNETFSLPYPLPVVSTARRTDAPRVEPVVAPRGHLVGLVRAASADTDATSERAHVLELATQCLSRGIHLADAVGLALRALELGDDDRSYELCRETARWLAALGRHDEAAEVLRNAAGATTDERTALEFGLEAGDHASRSGDASGAAVIYRELAIAHVEDARPLERLAAIGAWSPGTVNEQRASDAWLEASARRKSDLDRHLDMLRAFEIWPGHKRAAFKLAEELERQGRIECADEVLRLHGEAAGEASAVARERLERARRLGSRATAFGAALDLLAFGTSLDESVAILEHELEDATRGEETRSGTNWDTAKTLASAAVQPVAHERAEALMSVADGLASDRAAACYAMAAAAMLEAGNPAAALRNVRRARGLSPRCARVAGLVFALGSEEDVTASELESALGAAVPRSSHYRIVARRSARRGRPRLAWLWMKQALTLRPGDPELRQRALTVLGYSNTEFAFEELSTRALDVLTSPYPSDELVGPLCRVLDALRSLNPPRAAEFGLETVRIVGPREDLVDGVFKVLDPSVEPHLAAEIAGLDAAANGGAVPDKWLRAVELATPFDVEVAAAHLSQAAAQSAESNLVARALASLEASLDRLAPSARSDAELDLATARAWLAERGNDDVTASARWRELGNLRWDLARDLRGAEDAYFYAYARSSSDGGRRYVSDLVERSDQETALARLEARIAFLDDTADTRLRGPLLCRGAELALALGRDAITVSMALAALETLGNTIDALRTLDTLATRLAANGARREAADIVARAYEVAAMHAAGVQGRRTAWYRGARHLEALGDHVRALGFAVRSAALRGRSAASGALLGRLCATLREALDEASLKRAVEAALATLPSSADLGRKDRASAHEHLRRDLDARLGLSTAPAHTDASPRRPPSLEASGGALAFEARSAASGIATREVGIDPIEALDDGSTWTEDERALASRGDLRVLDEILQRRIEQASGDERGRLRRRRASQLARGDRDLAGACDELVQLLAERASADVEVLGQLARWLEARGVHAAAGERWLELLELTPNGEQAILVAVRASEAYLEAKDFANARLALDRIAHLPPTAEVVLMQLALANASEDEELLDFPRVAVEQSQSVPTTDAGWRNFGVASPEDAHRLEDLRTKIAKRPEASRDLVDEDEIAFLEEELDDGEWAAGEHLAAIYAANPERFDKEYLSVRHRQAVLMPGAQGPLEALLTAARACHEPWYADAVEHVLDTFHGRAVRPAPAIEDVAEAPQALAKLLFGDLEGTVCDAMALAYRGGLLRENARAASLSEQEEVGLDSGTFVARIVAAMTRRLPLEGVKVFARASDEPAHHRVVLRAPLCVVVSGALTESPRSAYAIGSALAAATPPCAYTEVLDESELDVLVRALLAAFGPVPEEPGRITEPLFAQLTQDLWSVVLGADERRVRDLCYDPTRVSPGLARHLAGRARRRTGLFACGDLPTALEATAAELGLWSSYPHGDPDGLRDLCTHPSLANLVALALDPTYARLRWMRVPGPPSSPRMR